MGWNWDGIGMNWDELGIQGIHLFLDFANVRGHGPPD